VSAYQLPLWVWPSAVVAVSALAIRRGGNEERLAAATVVMGWALSLVVFKDRSQDTQWEVLLIDCGVFAVYLWLALRSRRYWPIFAAGFKLLGLITHLAHAIDEAVSGWAYITAELIFSYLALFTIGYAAWTAPNYAAAKGEPTEAGATRL
jgi:hypothetical protein